MIKPDPGNGNDGNQQPGTGNDNNESSNNIAVKIFIAALVIITIAVIVF